jgi:hypothetical protein
MFVPLAPEKTISKNKPLRIDGFRVARRGQNLPGPLTNPQGSRRNSCRHG